MNRADRDFYVDDRIVGARRKKDKVKGGLVILGGVLVMAAVMYLTVSLCMWISDKLKENDQDPIVSGLEASGVRIDSEGNIVDADGNIISATSDSVVYNQEELNKRVEAAKAEGAEEILDRLRTGVTEGDSVIQALRPLFPDELIVSSGGKYHFVPINYGMKQNQYEQANLDILDTGEYQYVQDGQVISHKGIDVSKHQGEIDWKLVAADGVEFAFIRVGNRGYGTGKLVEDEYFEENIEEALSAGIKVGVYFYSQAINEEEVLEEANFVLNKIAPYKLECPVVFDVEKVTGASGRMNDISLEERTNLTLLFCQTIENAGYKPMIYHNMEMGVMMLDLEPLEAYDKWFASYSDQLYYPYEYKIWQYTQTGRVQGIKGDVDLNISFAPIWE